MTMASPLPPPPVLPATGHALLLDFDGTLVDLVDRPDAVVVDGALIALLQHLLGTFNGRVALVSGRSIAQIERFLAEAVPELSLVGSHGAELKLRGELFTPQRPAALDEVEQAFRTAFAGDEGVVIEVKTLGVAVHYRMAPERAAEAQQVAERFADANGVVMQTGKMMIELRAGGHDKGSGIAALLRHPPFANTAPIFAGDDVTDEAGFAAVAALNGFGVLVGPQRDTQAAYRLNDVAAVRDWLAATA